MKIPTNGEKNYKKLGLEIKGEPGYIIKVPGDNMRSSKGFRSGTRNRLKKRGESIRIAEFMKEFKADQRVAVRLNPSSHKGMPHKFQET